MLLPVQEGAPALVLVLEPRAVLMDRNGFTMLEAVVALGLFTLLTVSASQLLMHTTRTSSYLIARQEAMESARVAVDSLVINLQKADEIVMVTYRSDGMLRRLDLRQINPRNIREWYEFRYDRRLPPTSIRYNRLEFGRNELASHLNEVRLVLEDDGWISITVVTDGSLGEPVTLTGRADVRYKSITEVFVN